MKRGASLFCVGVFLLSACGANASMMDKVKGWLRKKNPLFSFRSVDVQKRYYIDRKEGRYLITEKKEQCPNCKHGKIKSVKVAINRSNYKPKRHYYFGLTKNLATGETKFKSRVSKERGRLLVPCPEGPRSVWSDGTPVLFPYELENKLLLENVLNELDKLDLKDFSEL